MFTIQVIVLDRSGTAGGLQFGARYLSPLLPVLLLLAFGNADAAIRDAATPRRRDARGTAIGAARARCRDRAHLVGHRGGLAAIRDHRAQRRRRRRGRGQRGPAHHRHAASVGIAVWIGARTPAASRGCGRPRKR
ncbi:MAG: hypothetical protein ABIY55_02285 [Kofleriaceae bacterium]